MISNSQTVQGDDERDRRLAEAEILVKIADIEKAAVSAQVATLRSQNGRL
jgi:hypothetical protein